MEFLLEYQISIIVIGLVGLLMFIQLVIADIIAIKNKHIPGYPIKSNHRDFLFRASRAHLNTNESVAIFVLFVIFCFLSSASASVVNTCSLAYLTSRIGHMIFYYLDFKVLRSISFATSLVSLLALFFAGMLAWL
ncbi:MAPEG family protein [Photobacterium rosenbergii]|uniref:MAPEG family protein n=1 Tax=Photobacterium rosenbergii TaxID=294936 RepID=A0ABU3ZIX2_9GAMM|nr:MAPEG family protein [Photobacterium rosenbergii]MDV5170074.1 MAPEG family protein [Photobacterium rosenbergii]